MRRVVAVSTATLLAVLMGASAASGTSDTGFDPNAEASAAPEQAVPVGDGNNLNYDGDPGAEAQLVQLEERRLLDIQLVSSGILVPELDVKHPFRVTGSQVSTLVLPARPAAYTIQELNQLSPATIESRGNGEFVLNESIAVMKGAILDIRSRGALTLKMASGAEGYTSIVSLGGQLIIQGDPGEPAIITSWDPTAESSDRTTADGRAYIRAVGGQVSITDADITDLGFWSGLTGGIALTGMNESIGLGLGIDSGSAEIAEGVEDGAATDGGAAPDQEGELAAGDPDSVDADVAQPIESSTQQGTIEEAAGDGLLPEGVTAWLSNVTITGNAFGVFASSTTAVEIHDSLVKDSLVTGIVFHREVQRGRIENTESSNNAGDGIRIARGSSGAVIDNVVANNNGANGIMIDAGPLSTGPSAVGLSAAMYGGHTVRLSTARDNGSAGIRIVGGDGILLESNRVVGSPFGIVLSEGGTDVRIESNRVEQSSKQGIALRDGVTAEIYKNTVSDTPIGVYVRSSVAQISNNDIRRVYGHGVTVVGESEGTTVTDNRFTGRGSSPVDVARAEGVVVDEDANTVASWQYHSFLYNAVSLAKRPLTLMWLSLAALLIFTAFSGVRHRRSGFGSPYRDRTPLSQYSAGLVDPTTVPGARPPLTLASRTSDPTVTLPRRSQRDASERVGV
jgi:hypothetical protein